MVPRSRSACVLVVDDDPSICTAIRRLLRSEGLEVRTFGTTAELFAHGRPDGPCCLVLDLRLGAGDSGLVFLEELTRAGIRVPTIFVTGYGDVPTSVRAMKLGAVDFLTKPCEPDQLIEAVLTALEADERAIDAQRLLALVRHRHGTLTSREQEVFVLVASGMLNKQVAIEFGISEKMVKVHRARVMEKMGAEALADLVRMADVLGLPCHRIAAPDAVAGASYH